MLKCFENKTFITKISDVQTFTVVCWRFFNQGDLKMEFSLSIVNHAALIYMESLDSMTIAHRYECKVHVQCPFLFMRVLILTLILSLSLIHI